MTNYNAAPQYDTRWYDSRNRTTRLGFEAGCVERRPVKNQRGVEAMLYYNAVHNVYVVKRSDWNIQTPGGSGDPYLKNFWWEGTNLKEARKVLNAMAKGVPISVHDLMVEESKVCESVNE